MTLNIFIVLMLVSVLYYFIDKCGKQSKRSKWVIVGSVGYAILVVIICSKSSTNYSNDYTENKLVSGYVSNIDDSGVLATLTEYKLLPIGISKYASKMELIRLSVEILDSTQTYLITGDNSKMVELRRYISDLDVVPPVRWSWYTLLDTTVTEHEYYRELLYWNEVADIRFTMLIYAVQDIIILRMPLTISMWFSLIRKKRGNCTNE